MKYSALTRSLLAGAGVSLLAAGAANAGAIYTPMLFLGDGDQIVCIANNVSPSQITVVVSIRGTSGNTTEQCVLAANDADGCQAFRNGDGGYCRITVKAMTNAEVFANVRGSLFTRKTTPPFAAGAIVQAR